LKFEHIPRSAQAGSGWIPEFPAAGNLAAIFFNFPVTATMAGPNLCRNPRSVPAIREFPLGSGQGIFFCQGRELFRTGREFIGRDGMLRLRIDLTESIYELAS
jgi:hypothetical protein